MNTDFSYRNLFRDLSSLMAGETSFVTMMANTSSLLYNRMENIILCAGEGYLCSWTIPGEHCLFPNSGRLRRLRDGSCRGTDRVHK